MNQLEMGACSFVDDFVNLSPPALDCAERVCSLLFQLLPHRLFKIFNLFPTHSLWQPEGKPVPVAKCSSCRVTGPLVSRVSLEAAEGSPRAEEGSRWSGGERHRGARERGSEESALLIEVCLLVEGQPCSGEARFSV